MFLYIVSFKIIELILRDVFVAVFKCFISSIFWGYLYKSGLFLHIFGGFRAVLDILARCLCKNVLWV